MVTRVFILLCCACSFAHGSDPYPRNRNIDVLHYTFRLELNDTTDVINGNSDVTVRFREQSDRFTLNLIDKQADGTGMRVFGITQSGKPVLFIHAGDRLEIHLATPSLPGDTLTYSISYNGIPKDGLVISKNKFGDRTFFGDNWPDRGRHWLPAVDHPYDKAKVDFIITAPRHYKIIATGELVGERDRPRNQKESHWREHVDVPVKVMTIGVARFSVKQSGMVGNIPITTWVFPQNEEKGFSDFAVAPGILDFMQNYIGPFPYEKLAHVQSKTRWGGLENASNIFYFENSVTGKNEREGLIAHETAHQWFGNTVSEDDWHHVWLSEGFATYFDALYMGSKYGEERMQSEMGENRKAVIEYTKKNKAQIIDTTIRDIGKVLNTSTYQKAAWVLHMLRIKIGEASFQAGIRDYYATYRNSNAMTADFIKVMERASQQELDDFFGAWLLQSGHPRISATWTYDKKAKSVKIQLSEAGFKVPPGTSIDIGTVSQDGTVTVTAYKLDERPGGAISIPAGQKPSRLILDPEVHLLFEGEITPASPADREKR